MSEGYEALRRGAAYLDVSTRGRITAHGRDRARLLHNLTSNEIKKMTPGSGCYAFLLSPQGRIQADLNILCFEDHFLLETDPELREKVYQHIRRYIIADQVELVDVTAGTSEIALEGPGAAAVLASLNAPNPGADYAHVKWGDATVAVLSISGQPGFRVISSGTGEDMVRQLAAAGASPATEEDFRQVRIENGKPRYGEDIRENSLPQETQQMHAVSFTKGCYLGQEIVERIRAQGHVNKKLVRFEMDASEIPAAGTKLTAGDAEAGEITSSVYSSDSGKVLGMAYVRTPHANPATELLGGAARVLVR
ncbi:MAG TPA: glycine cleavage T C-terminal barrel domain-containing protein [Candidatus Sulfopaludibacter sp.]|jgi:aminomethyltransferase|nr:glycine cleavage T C-terminal barrel domain-containing protein [Candidatus Sulfopaludibacter sp.]